MASAAAVLTMMATAFFGAAVSASMASASQTSGEVGTAAYCFGCKNEVQDFPWG